MSTQVQFRRGTTAQTTSFTGVTAEITVDTTKNTVVVHDGSTAGGFPLAKESALSSNAASVTAAFNTANAAFLQANTPSYTANSAASYANAAFNVANTASSTGTSAGVYANSAYNQANTATTNAATADAKAVTSGAYANAAFLQANTPSYTANSAASYANSAFTRANNSIDANNGGTITGDLNISGNLTVTGYTTYTNTTTLLVSDNIITVNSAINQSAQPAVNAGIEVDRGAQPNSSFLWIETSGKWAANNGNASIFVASDSAESYANAAFIRANNSLNANTGGTVAGPIVVDNGSYGNVTITQFASVWGQASGPNAYSIVQTRSNDDASGIGMQAYAASNGMLYANTGIQFKTSATLRDKDYPTGGTNAGQFAANGAFIAQSGIASTSNTSGAIQVVGGVGVKGNVYADNINVTNRVDWPAAGYAPPSFTTRSAGTKLTIYPAISGSSVDYAIGINGGVLWTSVPEYTSSYSFKWYGGDIEVASISGTGQLTTATANIISATSSTSNTTGALTVQGGIGVKGNVATDKVIFADGTSQSTAGATIGDALALSIALG